MSFAGFFQKSARKNRADIVGLQAGLAGAVTEGEPPQGVDGLGEGCKPFSFGLRELEETLGVLERRGWTGTLEDLLRATERRERERWFWIGTAGRLGDPLPRAR